MSQKSCPFIYSGYTMKSVQDLLDFVYNTVALKSNCRHFSVNISASDAPKTVYN